MPTAIDELLAGTLNRAKNAQEAARSDAVSLDFAIGLEGGFFTRISNGTRFCFLQSWACVLKDEAFFFGSSGAMPVPPIVADQVLEDGAELGLIIDRFGAEKDIRSKGGAYDVFSRGLINRQQSFELALMCALTPFINPELYKLTE